MPEDQPSAGTQNSHRDAFFRWVLAARGRLVGGREGTVQLGDRDSKSRQDAGPGPGYGMATWRCAMRQLTAGVSSRDRRTLSRAHRVQWHRRNQQHDERP